MRITYVLLSATFGMHQYTADLAAQMVQCGNDVDLVTTAQLPPDRYSDAVQVHTPLNSRSTGFGGDGLQAAALARVMAAIVSLQPVVVHITGVHLWNPLLLTLLRRRGIATVHTLHDLEPHPGVPFARLIRLWNRWVLSQADHVLVHGACYRSSLLQQGTPPERVSYLPLLHSFLSHAADRELQMTPPASRDEAWVLFFGRFERYKGLDHLLAAAARLTASPPTVVLAGQGQLAALWPRPLPPGVVVLDRHVDDATAIDLFQRCRAVVLPYTGATQSALPAAAFAFGKPVIVAASGALAENVANGERGWVVAPGDEDGLTGALQQALSDAESAQRMGLAGRRWYEEQRRQQPSMLVKLYDQQTLLKKM